MGTVGTSSRWGREGSGSLRGPGFVLLAQAPGCWREYEAGVELLECLPVAWHQVEKRSAGLRVETGNGVDPSCQTTTPSSARS